VTKPKLSYESNIYLLKRCLGLFKDYKVRVIVSFLAMLVVAGTESATAFLVQPALDDIFINKNRQALVFIPALIIVIILVQGVFRFLQNYLMQFCGLKVLEDLRYSVYSKMIYLPLRFYEDHQVGMLMSRIINDVMLIRNSLPSVIMLLRQMFTMVGLIGVVFYRDAFLATFAVLVLPLAVYPFIFFGKKLRKLGRKNQVVVADMSSFLQEVISGIRVVKAFANEKGELGRFFKENSKMVTIALRQIVFSEMSSPVMELVGAVGMGLVIWYGGMQVIEGTSTPGTFFSFLAGLILLYDPVKKLNSANQDLQKALAGAERVFEILDSKDIRVEDQGRTVFQPPFAELVFDHVTLRYPGNESPALDDVSLCVRAGETVALVGPSGSGKTTLVNLIPRFYQPEAGEIRLNGRPVAEYTLQSLRLAVGMVSQDTFLFNAPVRENIAYAAEGAAQERIEAAARAAFAHDFVLELPQGYDTVVGERGVKLSGGQKQRLTIARALLKNPPLLILDEATSALDTESERIVQLALENLMKDRTSIVIAHRLSTILNADRIVVMEKGRIIAQDRHATLLTTCPLYAKLYEMQFKDNSRADGSGEG